MFFPWRFCCLLSRLVGGCLGIGPSRRMATCVVCKAVRTLVTCDQVMATRARKAHAHPQSCEKTQSGNHAFPLGIHGRRRGRRTFHPRVHGRREGKERKSLFINSSFSATSSVNPWVKRTSSFASSMNSQCKRTSARWAGGRRARLTPKSLSASRRRKVSHRLGVKQH